MVMMMRRIPVARARRGVGVLNCPEQVHSPHGSLIVRYFCWSLKGTDYLRWELF